MKRTSQKNKKEKTLFSYFTSVKAPPKKESLSTLIDRTNPKTTIQTTTTTTAKTKTIDLTEEDDDIVFISSQNTVIDLESSQSSFQSSSQSSMSRLNTTEMVNNSKYNRKGWSVEAKERGPQKSSQDSRLSQEKKPSNQFERLQLNKPRINAKPSFGWLGPNDIKPYSSNFSPFVSASDYLKDEAPRISSKIERSNSQHSTLGKRSWSDNFDFDNPSSSTSSSYGSGSGSGSGSTGWGNDSSTSNTKRRVLPSKPKDNNWTNSKARPGNARQAYSKVAYGKSDIMNMPTPSSDYTPELSEEQKRVYDMVVRDQKSLFFTGSAGTGKSVLLRAIIEKLKSVHGSRVAVTASTGIAACNINGCTLHR